MPLQQAHAGTEIATEIPRRAEAPRLAQFLLARVEPAEGGSCCLTGRIPRLPTLHPRVGLLFDVKRQFVVDLVVEPAASQGRSKSQASRVDPAVPK